jgi:hypothetical protein
MSNGERIDKQTIDSRVRAAKQKKLQQHERDYGYFFCEECGRNEGAAGKLDCSHTVSVNDCQKEGRSELAWDVENIRLLCRKCHEIHDKNGVQWR